MVTTLKLAFAIVLFAASLPLYSQSKAEAATNDPNCGLKKEVLDPLVAEAERDQFNTRHVEFVGPTYTRGREFFKRMVNGMSQGDVFTRSALERSVRNVGKMKQVYPITIEDTEVRLDRANRYIDITICVVQKPRLN
ncbi:MAG TPA: hypothetical protein VJV05_09400 [Pyrinomonadaceae bacterium]|nr:hypothetical protein [Pyrinomonadaceae bacterium]